MAWLCAALRTPSWASLILILLLMILHQEMFGEFFRRTEVFEVIILVFFAILLVCTIHNVCKKFNIYH